MKNIPKLKKIISNFNRGKILVVGDLILDEFIWGTVSRISPEAPIPVVWVKSESFMPGGASNVANNIYALGGKPFICGVIGKDERGKILLDELSRKGIDIGGIVIDNERPTTLKTRVIAHNQQVVRIDRERIDPLDDNILSQILTYIKEKISKIDAIVIEDYGKGVIIPRLLQEVIALSRSHKKIVTVDPKEEHFSYYEGVTILTPNLQEAQGATGIKENDVDKVGKELLKRLKCGAVLVTLGENGMSLFESTGSVTHIPTVAQEVFDVSGAGDTVISAFTQALVCGASMAEAAYISNYAAGIVVGKIGIAAATQDELLERLSEVK